MSTHDVSNEPVITAYAQAPARTITAGGVDFAYRAIADQSGKINGFMKIVRDRTREVSLAKTKTEFITVASHQLRTPITNLEWSIETIAGDTTLSPELKSIADNAAVSVKELHSIVEDLLIKIVRFVSI